MKTALMEIYAWMECVGLVVDFRQTVGAVLVVMASVSFVRESSNVSLRKIVVRVRDVTPVLVLPNAIH